MNKRTLRDLEVSGRTVLVRADFNVPIEEGADRIGEYDHRLRVTVPTINYLLERNSKVVLCSHLGRPRGKVVETLRMRPIAQRLSTLLGRPVTALEDCVGPGVQTAVAGMGEGDVALLENLRFYAEEEKNDPAFARELAAPADLFVLDAFGAAHRAHASIVGVSAHLPSAAGLLLEREVDMIGGALDSPERPLAAVLGGAKVSDKIRILENLLGRVNALYIGGGMAATFLKAQGKGVGESLVEEELVDFAGDLMGRAGGDGVAFHLPVDVVVASEFAEAPREVRTVRVDQVPERYRILDIGPDTVAGFREGLGSSKTVIWNGPMGVFEFERFAAGTRGVAAAVAELDAVTIIGGGSTAEAVESLGLRAKMTHVSSGGGAMLEFLEGRELPGIAALPDRERGEGNGVLY